MLDKKIQEDGNGKQALQNPDGTKLEILISKLEMASNELPGGGTVSKLLFSIQGCAAETEQGEAKKDEFE